jgi:hypothetical protein
LPQAIGAFPILCPVFRKQAVAEAELHAALRAGVARVIARSANEHPAAAGS